MPTQQTVLLVGGTGRTGRRALQQLLDRGIGVRAIVRSGGKLPPQAAGHPNLRVIEASLLSLPDDELQRHLGGCGAVVSCLGHVLSLRGVFGPPRDLVTRATTRLCRPDSLLEGEVSEYALHEGLVNSLFAPGSTNMSNVAHFMCELVTQRPG
jgi:hypothetical protein